MNGFFRRWKAPLRDVGLIAAALTALSFLPADTSLAERQASGQLRYCVGDVKSPLITHPQTGAPGPERAQLEAVAQRLGLRVQLVQVSNIGRSFNPADWSLSRAQCDVLGGGFADTPVNRGFMTLIPTGGEIGLRLTGADADPPRGTRVGVFAGSAGFDRVRLSGWMRGKGWQPVPLRRPEDLRAWVASGAPAIVSSLEPLAEGTPHHATDPAAGEISRLVFGLWRGDTTFTRAFRSALEAEK